MLENAVHDSSEAERRLYNVRNILFLMNGLLISFDDRDFLLSFLIRLGILFVQLEVFTIWRYGYFFVSFHLCGIFLFLRISQALQVLQNGLGILLEFFGDGFLVNSHSDHLYFL